VTTGGASRTVGRAVWTTAGVFWTNGEVGSTDYGKPSFFRRVSLATTSFLVAQARSPGFNTFKRVLVEDSFRLFP
jgi:hypothetical protein